MDRLKWKVLACSCAFWQEVGQNCPKALIFQNMGIYEIVNTPSNRGRLGPLRVSQILPCVIFNVSLQLHARYRWLTLLFFYLQKSYIISFTFTRKCHTSIKIIEYKYKYVLFTCLHLTVDNYKKYIFKTQTNLTIKFIGDKRYIWQKSASMLENMNENSYYWNV